MSSLFHWQYPYLSLQYYSPSLCNVPICMRLNARRQTTVVNLSERECKCVKNIYRTFFKAYFLSYESWVYRFTLKVTGKKSESDWHRIQRCFFLSCCFAIFFYCFCARFFHNFQCIQIKAVVDFKLSTVFAAHYDFVQSIHTFINFYQRYQHTKPTLLQLHTQTTQKVSSVLLKFCVVKLFCMCEWIIRFFFSEYTLKTE